MKYSSKLLLAMPKDLSDALRACADTNATTVSYIARCLLNRELRRLGYIAGPVSAVDDPKPAARMTLETITFDD